MSFCVECGEQLEQNQVFCTSCGTKVTEPEGATKDEQIEQTDPIVVTPVHTPELVEAQEATLIQEGTPSPVAPRKPMSTRNKVIIGSIVAIIILLFGTHTFLTAYFDPLKMLTKISDATTDDDVDAFYDYISIEDNALFDKESYFNYIKENEWNEAVISQYTRITERDVKSKVDQTIESEFGDPLFIMKHKSIMGLYHTYSLHAVPNELHVTSSMDETDVIIAGIESDLEDLDTTITIAAYPGSYDITAKASNEYGDFEKTDSINVEAKKANYYEIAFDYREVYFHVDYDFLDAVLFVNEERTENLLGELGAIGPIPEKADVSFHVEWTNSKGDTFKSEVIQLKDVEDNEIEIVFDESEVKKSLLSEKEAGEYVIAFRGAYEQAVNNADFSAVEDYLKPGGHAAKDLKPFIRDMGGAHYYDFQENTILKTKQISDTKYEVDTNEIFSYFDEKNKRFDYDREKRYFIEVVGDEFQIERIDYIDTKKKKK